MLKRRKKTIGKDVENFHAATTISISDTKNSVMIKGDAKMDNYRALFTQPWPKADLPRGYKARLSQTATTPQMINSVV